MWRRSLWCLGLLCSLGALAPSLWAGPAPWYVWRSQLHGQELCAQTSPGEAWVRQGGPFVDADCRRSPPRLKPM